MIAIYGQNQIILLPISSAILMRVVNDMVCPNRTNQVHIPRAAHGSDFRPEGFCKLHSKGPNAASRPMNQHLLSGLNLSCITQTLQRGECRDRSGGSFLKRTIG